MVFVGLIIKKNLFKKKQNPSYFPRNLKNISMKKNSKFDVIIIGGGHAGIEAAVSCSKRGIQTLLLTLNLDKIGWQPCNPSIGGPAKSTLVQEIDALGGLMGKITDRTFLHKKILNKSKGPAVWALRAQTDKREYSEETKKILDNLPNLTIQEGMVSSLFISKNLKVEGVQTYFGGFIPCKAVIVTTGTFLGGTIWIGSKKISAGRAGEMASFGLTQTLKTLEIKTGRLKTGTPPRIDSRNVNYNKLQKQKSDENDQWFSFDSIEWNSRETMDCFLTHTTPETFCLIKKNLHLSPKYGGFMKSTGPRYCPSIEDKIVRFSDKIEHQIFLEPEGRVLNEFYIQGMSTGLPERLQVQLLKSIPGLENSKMVRPAYSVDYDYVYANQLDKNLMSKISGLFFAGQICGTTGYEEAGAQGLLAGLNASLFCENKSMVCLSREGSFIGTLIDDLCTKHLNEPYRVLTSRSEFRLLLRGENADFRLVPMGKKYNLISNRRWEKFKKKVSEIQSESRRLNNTFIKTNSNILKILESETNLSIKKECSLSKLITRSNFDYKKLTTLELHNPFVNLQEIQRLEVEIKYTNYIERQELHIKNLEKVMDTQIKKNMNFMKIFQISKEGREKLTRRRPVNLREACSIGGISTSDVQNLFLFLKK
ncbi:glucose inhibited division protein A (nucleomorph) [Chroomonas mesostigmatica CCMP1168]|uniref:Glucose inhibited division protein A n=1 Tax=Chroomonas mesostigmatica CCMP1168 TaxID=1195612 RepID=J7G9X9_9CRYP|nr:glucose inhibited division protein A [Chroomonas mesostigmatica CCMP1168]|mmetsp:Transcript_25619/g.63123  ORF Transcript_25619/g.63123 Transcript_25619/m.63123 type:complete len:651 (+) Transcript_25619:48-2000(+)